MTLQEVPKTIRKVLATVLRDIVVYWKIFVLILTPVLLLPLPLMIPSQVSDRDETFFIVCVALYLNYLLVMHFFPSPLVHLKKTLLVYIGRDLAPSLEGTENIFRGPNFRMTLFKKFPFQRR